MMSKENRSQWKELSIAKVGMNLATKSGLLDNKTKFKKKNKTKLSIGVHVGKNK